MQDDKYKHPLQRYKQNLFEPLNTWFKRPKQPLKSGVLGAKVGSWASKIMSWQPNQKGNMVQNAGKILKNGVKQKCASWYLAANCPLSDLDFRQNGVANRVCFVKYDNQI